MPEGYYANLAGLLNSFVPPTPEAFGAQQNIRNIMSRYEDPEFQGAGQQHAMRGQLEHNLPLAFPGNFEGLRQPYRPYRQVARDISMFGGAGAVGRRAMRGLRRASPYVGIGQRTHRDIRRSLRRAGVGRPSLSGRARGAMRRTRRFLDRNRMFFRPIEQTAQTAGLISGTNGTDTAQPSGTLSGAYPGS